MAFALETTVSYFFTIEKVKDTGDNPHTKETEFIIDFLSMSLIN